MFSAEYIKELSDEAAELAASEGRQPYVPWDGKEVASYGEGRPVPFPFLGSYEPAGWTLIEEKLVDSTGMGDESEPALTIRGLREWVTSHLHENNGYAITEEGQFQVRIGRFAGRFSPVVIQ